MNHSKMSIEHRKALAELEEFSHDVHMHTNITFFALSVNLFPWLMKWNIPPLFLFECSCVHIQITAN